MRTLLLTLIVVVSSLPSQVKKVEIQEKPKRQTFDTPGVTFELPKGWKPQKIKSRMRLATWRLPGKEPVDVVCYWFGQQGAGDLKANLERWRNQIRTEKDPKESKLEITKGITGHLVDARGTYVAPIRPGAEERNNKPNQRLLAAVLATPGGPIYVKAVGPAKVLDRDEKAFMTWLKSFRPLKKK